ncbi:MAG: glycosyltransferase [Patescibacteria group bacterium]
MKTLLVITKAEIGGAQSFILTLAKGLKKCENQVAVAAGEGNFLPEELKKENINFFRLNNLKRSRNPLAIIGFILELKKLIDKNSFDVLHLNSTNTLPGVLAAKLSKLKPKIIFTMHGLSVLDPNYNASKFIKFIFKIYFKFFLRFVDKVVFVSKCNLIEATKQKIIKDGTVIYNGLDINQNYFLTKNQAREELGKLINVSLSEDYLIGSIGRLAPQKNYNFIINAWPEIKKIKANAKLIIIGEGPEREKYQRLIKSIGALNDIFLVGEIIDASRFLKGLDIFVLPSVYEGLSISLIEAGFSDISILASDVGGNSEIVNAENCFIFDDQKDFLDKLSKNMVARIDQAPFSAKVMIKRYQEIYE